MTLKIICPILTLLWIPDSSIQAANLTDIQSTWISNVYLKSIAKHNLVFSPSAHLFFLQFSPSQKCHHHRPFTQVRNQEHSLVSLSNPPHVQPQKAVLVHPPTIVYARPSQCSLSTATVLAMLPSSLTWTNTRASHLLSLLLWPLQPILHSATRVVLIHLNWPEASPHVKLPKGFALLLGSSRAPYPECPPLRPCSVPLCTLLTMDQIPPSCLFFSHTPGLVSP